MSSYLRFFSMIIVATIVMYVLMYLNTYSMDHIYWSETRAYMALVMGSVMTIIMMGFMARMLTSRKANKLIYLGGFIVFAGSLYLVRSQRTVDDLSWMRAMIPHHSIAILTSERAQIKDSRVRELANRIIVSQTQEIAEMKEYIRDLEAKRDQTGKSNDPVSH